MAGSGFGNYSSPFSAFAKNSPSTPTTAGKAGEESKEGEAGQAGPSKSSFGDILKETKADQGEVEDKVQMTEKDGKS